MFWVLIFRNFGIIETSRAFNIGAIGAIDNHDVAPVGDDGIEFFLIKLFGGGKIYSIGIVIFELNVIISGFKIRTEGGH